MKIEYLNVILSSFYKWEKIVSRLKPKINDNIKWILCKNRRCEWTKINWNLDVINVRILRGPHNHLQSVYIIQTRFARWRRRRRQHTEWILSMAATNSSQCSYVHRSKDQTRTPFGFCSRLSILRQTIYILLSVCVCVMEKWQRHKKAGIKSIQEMAFILLTSMYFLSSSFCSSSYC